MVFRVSYAAITYPQLLRLLQVLVEARKRSAEFEGYDARPSGLKAPAAGGLLMDGCTNQQQQPSRAREHHRLTKSFLWISVIMVAPAFFVPLATVMMSIVNSL